jgi:hypothetical protein
LLRRLLLRGALENLLQNFTENIHRHASEKKKIRPRTVSDLGHAAGIAT